MSFSGAAAASLTPDQIAHFEQKLHTARTAHASVQSRVPCLEAQDRELVRRRDADQLRLGELLSVRRGLEETIVQQAADRAVAEHNYEDEVRKAQALEEEFQAKLRAAEECNRIWTFMSFLFCAQHGAVTSLDALLNGSQSYQMMQNHIGGFSTQMMETGLQLASTQAALTETQAAAAAVTNQVTATETSIAGLQATLTALRDQVHDGKGLIDAFASALEDADKVDTADARARTARTVQTLAERIDAANRRSDALVVQARALLAQQQLNACFA